MRALSKVLTISLILLVGCQNPDPSVYWHDTAGGAENPGGSVEFDKRMAAGTRANLSGRQAEAEAEFRAALKLQRNRFGNDSPYLALPLMSLALQLSQAREYEQADVQFGEAERVLGPRPDPALRARLLHYRGVHLLNQFKSAEADAFLGAAQKAYIALIPEEDLTRPPVPPPSRNRFDINDAAKSRGANFKIKDNARMVQPALLGLIEVLRYRAIALRDLNRPQDADAATAYATRLAAANDLGRPSVHARLFQADGLTAVAESSRDRALRDYSRSDAAFEVSLPGTKPAAEQALIHAGELVASGKTRNAASLCRAAVKTLISISTGTTPELMAPCLDAYASGGLFGFSSANRADMFLAAQVAQGSITSHQIAQASASLAENARDPRIGAALHRRDDLQREVDRLYRALDTISGASTSGRAAEQAAQLQKQADAAQAAFAQADAEVRTLSPNFGQLVQDVVPAPDVFAAMHPDEVFVALFLSKTSGWTFALRNGDIAISKIEGGADVVGPLVTAVRAGIVPTQTNPLPTFDIDDTRRLYDLTLGGVADTLKGAKSLVVVPSGPLLSLPFEVLLTGPADQTKLGEAPWLMRQVTIAHVPAVANFVGLRKVANTSEAHKQWFGFGGFQPVSLAQADRSFPPGACGNAGSLLASLDPLKGAADELNMARNLLHAAPDDELLGDRFTAEQVLKTPLSDYKVLHFAAHALLPTDLRCQTEAAIVTSPPRGASDAHGALLGASELLGLGLDANLVILSACNSGGPDGGAGESLSGLARSFFFAHARSLLVTHWDVNDQVAAIVVSLTINNMLKHPELGVTGALRTAQLEMFDQAAAGKLPAVVVHPFFWAPFAVIGDGGEGLGRSAVASKP
jgi:CHAT domain-containing protein